MPNDILIKGGRIIDPSQKLDIIGSLLISNGKIFEISDGKISLRQKDTHVINAEGCIVCPGFIDLHCHLREPGFEDKETIASGTHAAAKGGFTTICCMPNTNPPIDNESTVNYIKKKAESDGIVRVLPIACITKGRQGKEITEMNLLADAGVVGFSDDGNPVSSSHTMYVAMLYSTITNLPIIDHCEDEELTKGGLINEGWVSFRLGLKGMPPEAEDIIVGRDILLANLTGAKLHLAHISTANSVELIRQAKKRGVNITAEVTPHHLLLTEETVIGTNLIGLDTSAYDTYTKVNPPLRTHNDIDSLIEGIKDGTIDAIATDHAPHTTVDKICEFEMASFGISGFETALSCLMSLVHSKKIDLVTLISLLTYKPANIIGKKFGFFGTLKTGIPADITVFHPNIEWVIDSNLFISKGKNSPFNGQKVKGKVIATIYNGNIVYTDKQLNRYG